MIRIDQPVPGYYSTRLVRAAILVPVKIWRDQDGLLRIEVDGHTERTDGEPLDVFEIWPFCAGSPISEHEYRYKLRLRRWAHEHDPMHPAANPHRPIDRRALKPRF